MIAIFLYGRKEFSIAYLLYPSFIIPLFYLFHFLFAMTVQFPVIFMLKLYRFYSLTQSTWMNIQTARKLSLIIYCVHVW